MRAVLIILLCCSCFSCREGSKNKSHPDTKKPSTETWIKQEKKSSATSYSNENWGFSLEYPQSFQVLESELPGKAPVINIYARAVRFDPPFGIHEVPGNAYIAVLPEGFGVDGPSGTNKTLEEWNENLNGVSGLNLEKSRVYLLESGQPWAFFLRFTRTPGNWKKYGGVFVHFSIEDFKAECFNSKSGQKKPMEKCDPMGPDEVRYTGKIQAESRKALMAILESFDFDSSETSISEGISVEKPLPGKDVASPLQVAGKARGYWFFEANAPIEILDKDYNKLGESYIEAKGDWMTEDFVEFTGTISFEAPDDERGYLVFKRANPSSLKEHDREFRIPVLFPPKKNPE